MENLLIVLEVIFISILVYVVFPSRDRQSHAWEEERDERQDRINRDIMEHRMAKKNGGNKASF